MTLSVFRLQGCRGMLAGTAGTPPVRGRAEAGATTVTQTVALTSNDGQRFHALLTYWTHAGR